ncbi:LuxR C-terminal-related transcriptional regulator [Nocardioides sp.]|uniref:LuxR C-terminal-related transcriptional regulator n=1 Tax=Nocardioides sp. TaxID=35761 RepID=UPI002ED41683
MDSRVIGREDVLSVLPAALDSERWLSLVGPPGCGKTTVLRTVVQDRDDVTWVNARGITALPDLLRTCLDELQVVIAPSDSLEGALKRALDGAHGWLIVDGVDVDDFDEVVADVIASTSEARVLTTSSTVHPGPGRRVVRLGPLRVPAAHEPLTGPAVDLFCRMVVDAGGHPIDLVEAEEDVRRLLRASGGLPLLIEQMAVQIALVGMSQVTPTASLAEAVQASYDLLDEDQQRCFRRLSTMSVPVSLEVLAAISDVDLDAGRELTLALARRSLVEALPDGRIDMLVPIRRHGAFLTATTDDEAAAGRALVRWADSVLPREMNTGAADAPWLTDLPTMRLAVAAACRNPETRGEGYALANRTFSSLYTAMRARDAAEILETALLSGDGPPEIGAQVARRAGIAASEARGTYEGLWLLDRADEHAREAENPDLETARTASIRAEMHLDAGDLDHAEAEALRAISLDAGTDQIAPQATRTLAQATLVRGDFERASELAHSLLTTRQDDEPWLTLSARLLLARIALEQGRRLEAATAAERVRDDARQLAEDRLALLAEVELCHIKPATYPAPEDDESFPWAVRLPVMVAQARRLKRTGHLARAAGRAADAVVLADSSRLGRDALDARLVLGVSLLQQGEVHEARATLLQALANAAAMPHPLRAADVLDALAQLVSATDVRVARSLTGAALALRTPRGAGSAGRYRARDVDPAPSVPDGWLENDQLTPGAVADIATLLVPTPGEPSAGPLDALTPAERTVADKVAEGLTSRQVASELFLSPRTVDAHLSRIYRKLGINTRARLAALVTDQRPL